MDLLRRQVKRWLVQQDPFTEVKSNTNRVVLAGGEYQDGYRRPSLRGDSSNRPAWPLSKCVQPCDLSKVGS